MSHGLTRPLISDTTASSTGDVRIRDSWPYGGVHVLEQLWKEFDIAAVLTRSMKTSGTQQPFERALFAMVANRALSPYSKLYCCEQWLREEVFLPSGRKLALQHLYRAMDFLEEHKAEIEKAVYSKTVAEQNTIRELASDLPKLWSADTTKPSDRKSVLRILIERVTISIDENSEWVDLAVRWIGGHETRTRFRRPVGKLDQLEGHDELMSVDPERSRSSISVGSSVGERLIVAPLRGGAFAGAFGCTRAGRSRRDRSRRVPGSVAHG